MARRWFMHMEPLPADTCTASDWLVKPRGLWTTMCLRFKSLICFFLLIRNASGSTTPRSYVPVSRILCPKKC